jgi:hypothetical protein
MTEDLSSLPVLEELGIHIGYLPYLIPSICTEFEYMDAHRILYVIQTFQDI